MSFKKIIFEDAKKYGEQQADVFRKKYDQTYIKPEDAFYQDYEYLGSFLIGRELDFGTNDFNFMVQYFLSLDGKKQKKYMKRFFMK